MRAATFFFISGTSFQAQGLQPWTSAGNEFLEPLRFDDLLALRRFTHEPSGGAGGLDERQAALRAEHAGGGGQAVRRRAVAGHDRDAAAAGQTEASPRIDDVRVALAGDL